MISTRIHRRSVFVLNLPPSEKVEWLACWVLHSQQVSDYSHFYGVGLTILPYLRSQYVRHLFSMVSWQPEHFSLSAPPGCTSFFLGASMKSGWPFSLLVSACTWFSLVFLLGTLLISCLLDYHIAGDCFFALSLERSLFIPVRIWPYLSSDRK